jgi:hypothetical protein
LTRPIVTQNAINGASIDDYIAALSGAVREIRDPGAGECMEIQFTTRIFNDGGALVAHSRELDVSS